MWQNWQWKNFPALSDLKPPLSYNNNYNLNFLFKFFEYQMKLSCQEDKDFFDFFFAHLQLCKVESQSFFMGLLLSLKLKLDLVKTSFFFQSYLPAGAQK